MMLQWVLLFMSLLSGEWGTLTPDHKCSICKQIGIVSTVEISNLCISTLALCGPMTGLAFDENGKEVPATVRVKCNTTRCSGRCSRGHRLIYLFASY